LYFKSNVSEFGSISSAKYENNIQEYYSSQSFAGTRLTNIPSRIPTQFHLQLTVGQSGRLCAEHPPSPDPLSVTSYSEDWPLQS